MKTFILAIGIALGIVMGSASYTREMDNISGQMADWSGQIIEAVQEDDFDGAAEKTQKLVSFVEDKKVLLSMVMDHTVLEKIESNLAELSGYVDGKMQTDALAKGRVLEVLFTRLPKNYKLRMENIL